MDFCYCIVPSRVGFLCKLVTINYFFECFLLSFFYNFFKSINSIFKCKFVSSLPVHKLMEIAGLDFY
jgi:hypothetical protein